ncbi:MAG: hypothetical protein KDA60_06655, partial [Planctomycetales bacterium]|nr:hypothetical protein [Planctomycetales bacterium]
MFRNPCARRRRLPGGRHRFRSGWLEQLEGRCLLATDLLSISNEIEQAEFDTGSSEFTFLVRLAEPALEQTTVNYNVITSDVDPTRATASDSDFDFSVTPQDGQLLFAPGQLVKPITIHVAGDSDFELSETFVISVAGLIGGATRMAEGEATILNDDLAMDDPIHAKVAAQGGTQVSDALVKHFRVLRQQVEQAARNVRDLPIVGEQLLAGMQPFLDQLSSVETRLSDLIDGIYTDLPSSGLGSTTDTLNGLLRLGLFNVFGPNGLDILLDGPDPGNTIGTTDVLLTYGQDANGVTDTMQFDFHLGAVEIVDLGFEIGGSLDEMLPFFDLRIDASNGIRFQLSWDVYFGFGFTTATNDLGDFYVNTGPTNLLGDEVPELQVSLDVLAAPPKDAHGNDIITNEPGINADGSLGLMHAHVEDGTAKRVTLTALRGQDIRLLGLRDYSQAFDLVVAFENPITGGLETATFSINYQSPAGGEHYATFLARLNVAVNSAINSSNSALAAELLPISIRPDLSHISSVENPGEPTTPSLAFTARTPLIIGLTLKGPRIHEWGFQPLVQTDDDRASSLGFVTGATSNGNHELLARLAAPKEIRSDI